ncbi:hypothetical protein H920_14330 [Fukomys damarensis]|uniref:Uncharacterized protein n=1 Tax=Fukomys damarensis TaxID=885580 RepID=A0A091D236_FUKDA|nr:hypothetical protein H920_14330 [Fukomys damarensis]
MLALVLALPVVSLLICYVQRLAFLGPPHSFCAEVSRQGWAKKMEKKLRLKGLLGERLPGGAMNTHSHLQQVTRVLSLEDVLGAKVTDSGQLWHTQSRPDMRLTFIPEPSVRS